MMGGAPKREFVEMPSIDRAEFKRDFESGQRDRMARALACLSLHEPDRQYVEDVLAVALQSPDAWVRGVAATCVGHVARIHRALDTARLVPLVRRLAANASTAGRSEDAIGDIAMFVRDPLSS